jgi:hypothetical protein
MSRTFAVSRGLIGAVAAAFVIGTTVMAALTTAPAPAKAQGNACVASCKASHNQCRIATKGNASCDGQLQACLQACLRK